MLKIRANKRFIYPLLITIILIYSIMPIVARFFSTYISTYAYMGLCVLTFALIVLDNGLESIQYYISFLFPFLLMKLLTFLNRGNSLVLWGYNILLEMLPIVIGLYLTKYEKRIPKLFSYAIIFSFIITTITTIIGLYRFPGATRWLATVGSSQDQYFITLNWNNVGDYYFIYSLVLIYPLVIYAYKKNKATLFESLFITVLVLILLLKAAYTIALLLFLITTCLYFVKKELTSTDIIKLFILYIFIYIIFNSFVSDALLRLSYVVEDRNMQERLYSLAGGYEGVLNSESNRVHLYYRSISTLLNNPLLGTFLNDWNGSGGHSYILDYCATYGLLGLSLLIWFYIYIYRVFYKPYRNNHNFGFILLMFIQPILLSIINTGSWYSVLCLYIPVLLKTINNEKENIVYM